MRATVRRHHLALYALLAAGLAWIWLSSGTQQTGQPGLAAQLPGTCGPWTATAVYFCHKETCLREYLASDLTSTQACPRCGGPLVKTWSLAERRLLPPDTELMKHAYQDPQGRYVNVAVVVTGKERVSIHGPEGCLAAQGYRIKDRRVVDIPLKQRPALQVMVLTASRDGRATGQSDVCFAYWFVTEEHETARNVERWFWTAVDAIFRNTRSRWAYISVSTAAGGDPARNLTLLRDFVGEFYPRIRRP